MNKKNVKNDRSALSIVRSAGDPRLPKAGTILTREHDGKTHRVEVLKDGSFLYARRRYTSLSSIALAITGKVWNGFAFFGLTLEEAAPAPKPKPVPTPPLAPASRPTLKKAILKKGTASKKKSA